jgi:hypothetical protein
MEAQDGRHGGGTMNRGISLTLHEDGTILIEGDDECAATPVVVALAARMTHDATFLDNVMDWFHDHIKDSGLSSSQGVPMYTDVSDTPN